MTMSSDIAEREIQHSVLVEILALVFILFTLPLVFGGGHHFMKTPVGDYLVAYKLPKS